MNRAGSRARDSPRRSSPPGSPAVSALETNQPSPQVRAIAPAAPIPETWCRRPSRGRGEHPRRLVSPIADRGDGLVACRCRDRRPPSRRVRPTAFLVVEVAIEFGHNRRARPAGAPKNRLLPLVAIARHANEALVGFVEKG